MFEYILFDLDGTITDPFEGISKCVIYALSSFGINVENPAELVSFIGPPLLEGFKAYKNFTDQQAAEAAAKYHERYSRIGWKECVLVDGVKPLLKTLKSEGKILAVATSKPEYLAVLILEHFGISEYFDFIGGAELSPSGRNSKEAVIEYVLKNLGITRRNSTVIIGDRYYDIDGAKKAGIHSVGVLSGYGSRQELEAHGADFIAENMYSVADIIL